MKDEKNFWDTLEEVGKNICNVLKADLSETGELVSINGAEFDKTEVNIVKLNPIEKIFYDYFKDKQIKNMAEAVRQITCITRSRNKFVYIVIGVLLDYTDTIKLSNFDKLISRGYTVDVKVENWAGSDYKQKFADAIGKALYRGGLFASPMGVLGAIKDYVAGISFDEEVLNKKTSIEDAVNTVCEMLNCWFGDYADNLEKDLNSSQNDILLEAKNVKPLLCNVKDEILKMHRFGTGSIVEHLDIGWSMVVALINEAKENYKNK